MLKHANTNAETQVAQTKVCNNFAGAYILQLATFSFLNYRKIHCEKEEIVEDTAAVHKIRKVCM